MKRDHRDGSNLQEFFRQKRTLFGRYKTHITLTKDVLLIISNNLLLIWGVVFGQPCA